MLGGPWLQIAIAQVTSQRSLRSANAKRSRHSEGLCSEMSMEHLASQLGTGGRLAQRGAGKRGFAARL